MHDDYYYSGQNEWGKKGMSAGCPGGETRQIKTLDDLRWLIELECPENAK